jgi:hypothetical protein
MNPVVSLRRLAHGSRDAGLDEGEGRRHEATYRRSAQTINPPEAEHASTLAGTSLQGTNHSLLEFGARTLIGPLSRGASEIPQTSGALLAVGAPAGPFRGQYACSMCYC